MNYSHSVGDVVREVSNETGFFEPIEQNEPSQQRSVASRIEDFIREYGPILFLAGASLISLALTPQLFIAGSLTGFFFGCFIHHGAERKAWAARLVTPLEAALGGVGAVGSFVMALQLKMSLVARFVPLIGALIAGYCLSKLAYRNFVRI